MAVVFSAEEQEQLLAVCKDLGAKPKFDNKDDFINWMRSFIAQQDGDASGSQGVDSKVTLQPAVITPDPIKLTSDNRCILQSVKEQLPRIPIFSGASPAKADHVPFEVWSYEIECLIKEKRYTAESVMHAARLSLRGEASRVAVRLGTDANINQLVEKMKHLYGTVEEGVDLLAKFYSAMQREEESVVDWSCRLEDLWEDVLQAGLLDRKVTNDTLKNKFWNGLKHPLHELAGYKFDQELDYEKFLVEVRKIERNLTSDTTVKQGKVTKHSTKMHVHQTNNPVKEVQPNNNVSQDMFQQLQAQVNAMAQQLSRFGMQATQPKVSNKQVPVMTPNVSVTAQATARTCWKCGKAGHIQRFCHAEGHLNSYRPPQRGMQSPTTSQPH